MSYCAGQGNRGFGSYSLKGLGINPGGGHFCPQAATDDRSVFAQTLEVPAGSPGIVGTYGDAPGWFCGCPPDFPLVQADSYYGRLCLKACPPGWTAGADNVCRNLPPAGTVLDNAIHLPANWQASTPTVPLNPANATPPVAQVTNAPVPAPQNVQISSAVPPQAASQSPGISLPGLPSSIGGISLSSIPWWGWVLGGGAALWAASKA